MNNIGIYVYGNTDKTINKQLKAIQNRIKKDYGKTTLDEFVLYIDRGKEIFDERVILKNLLSDIKNKKITKIYIDSPQIFYKSFKDNEKVLQQIFDENCIIMLTDLEEPYNKDMYDIGKMMYEFEYKNLKTKIRKSLYQKKTNNFNIKDLLNVEIKSERHEDKRHDYCYWYGGLVASIKASSGEYRIYARGQVRCNLIAKENFKDEHGNEYKKGEILATVIDKNEDGIFMNEMSDFIKDDSELFDILQGEHELYELEIGNSNWFNLEFYNKNGEFEYDYDLENISLDDAIEEVKEIIWDQNKNNIHYGIYCSVHSPDDSNHAINNQQNTCIKVLNDNIKDDTDIIRIYKDYSSPAKELPSSLTKMLTDIENKKIKNIYTLSLSRLTRDTEQLYNIQKILKENDADIFSIQENISIRDDLINIHSSEIKSIEKDNHDEIEY